MNFTSVAMLCLAAQQISAFPSYLSEAMLQLRNADPERQAEKLEAPCPHTKRKAEAEPEPGCPFAREKRQAPGVTPPFNAQEQYVSNTGAHAFIPPSGNDQRGPCTSLTNLPHSRARVTDYNSGPGLNAMANHGYMPHNGVGNMQDFITGTAAVYGMGNS